MKKNIYIFTRCIWTFINFRYDLVNQIDKKKFNIHVCMDFDGYNKLDLERKYKNIMFKDIKFLNSKNLFINNLFIFKDIFNLFFINKIDIAHNFTARPIVFVSLVSFFFKKTKLINTITGLGNNFFKNQFIFKFIYNLLFLRSQMVIFQNNLDKKIVYKIFNNKINSKIIYPTVKFKKNIKSKKKNSDKITFTMHCRMIRQKGVIEYINAAKEIKQNYKFKSAFNLIGDPDRNNPSSISLKYLKSLNKNNYISYHRHKKNIKNYVINSDVIVLPSYGEGMPGSLLEALFLKKTIITTNVNGCSELVKNNYNGYLIRARNTSDLINAIYKILKKPKNVNRFGQNSYKLFKKKFSKDPIKKYLDVYNSL